MYEALKCAAGSETGVIGFNPVENEGITNQPHLFFRASSMHFRWFLLNSKLTALKKCFLYIQLVVTFFSTYLF